MHSRHATATAFILSDFGFIAPHAGAVRNSPQNRLIPPVPPGPAAVWSTHIPRGDLPMGEFNQAAALELQGGSRARPRHRIHSGAHAHPFGVPPANED